MSPLVIAAHPMETAPLAKALPSLELIHFGVGAITAAQHAHACAEKCRGRDVIYVGTAGLFGDFQAPELYRPAEIAWTDYGIRSEQSYVIEGDLPVLFLDRYHRHAALDQLRPCSVVCSASISKSAQPPPPAQSHDWILENVELYSIAGPLQAAARTFTAVLATTNAIGPKAHQQWRQYAPQAARLTAEFLMQQLLKEL